VKDIQKEGRKHMRSSSSHRAFRAVPFALALGPIVLVSGASAATTVLYDQDFESPVNFVNDAGDVNAFRTVNDLYGGQPAGFQFQQVFTVETLLVTGSQAFGTGYTDPQNVAGNYVLGMLSNLQDDRLALSFDVGDRQFLNFQLDVSSIDLSVFSGPFVTPGVVPDYQFTLYDNPGGATSLSGNGTILDQKTGTANAANLPTVFDFKQLLLPLDASGNTDGNVTLQIDLLTGGYAAVDNFLIAASDTPGDVGGETPPAVPLPAALPVGLIVLGAMACRRFLRRTVD